MTTSDFWTTCTVNDLPPDFMTMPLEGNGESWAALWNIALKYARSKGIVVTMFPAGTGIRVEQDVFLFRIYISFSEEAQEELRLQRLLEGVNLGDWTID